MHRPQNILKYIKDAEERAKKVQNLTPSVIKVKDKTSFGLDFLKIFDIIAKVDEKNYKQVLTKLKNEQKDNKSNN